MRNETRFALMPLEVYTMRSILAGGNSMTGDRLYLLERYSLATETAWTMSGDRAVLDGTRRSWNGMGSARLSATGWK